MPPQKNEAQQTTAQQVFDREFLDMRAKVLSVAAVLDRVDLAPGELESTDNYQKLRQSIEILLRESSGRAEQVQLIFSRPYSTNWRQELEL